MFFFFLLEQDLIDSLQRRNIVMKIFVICSIKRQKYNTITNLWKKMAMTSQNV